MEDTGNYSRNRGHTVADRPAVTVLSCGITAEYLISVGLSLIRSEQPSCSQLECQKNALLFLWNDACEHSDAVVSAEEVISFYLSV